LIDEFKPTEDPIRQHMAKVMISFLAGLFVGEGKFEEIKDNLDLERWFRLPKSHERRIHGHRHAGIRIVQEGARWSTHWMRTWRIPSSSRWTICWRIAQPESRRAKNRR